MLSVMELQAVADGLLDPSEAVKLDRHAGGRPKGVKNQRDSLDKALEALLKARSGLTPRKLARASTESLSCWMAGTGRCEAADSRQA